MRIVVWAVGVLACAAIVLPGRIATDLTAFLPAGATPEQELVAGQLERGAASRLLLVAAGDARREVGPGELERLRAALAETGAFRLVATYPDPAMLDGHEILFDYRYLLSDRLDTEDFRAPALRATFAGIVAQLRRGDGAIDEEMLARDPTGEMPYLLRQWAGGAPADAVDGWRLDDGRPVLLAAADAAPYDLESQARALAAIEAVAAEFDPAVPVEIAGAPAVAVGTRDVIRSEAVRVTGLASIAAVLVLLVALRRAPAVVLALVPVVSGVLAGAAAVRLGFGEIHGITLAFGATLLGVTVDYPLHHLWRSRVAGTTPPERAIRRPLFVGALSTAVGFAALAMAGVGGLQQLALLAVTGIVVAAAVTSWVLPALARRPVARLQGPPVLPLTAPPWLAPTLAAVLIAGGLLAAATGARLDTNLATMSPVPAELAERDGVFRAALGLAEPRFVAVFAGSDRESALQRSEAARPALDAAVAAGHLDRYDTVVRLLPSGRAQAERAAALPSAQTLAPAVAAATADLPLATEAFAPFIEDVAASRERPALVADDLPAGLLRDWIDERLVAQRGEWLSLAPLAGVTDADAIGDALDNGRVLDLQREADRLVTGYQHQALLHFAIGAVLIAAVLFAGTRSARRTAQILLVAGGAVGGTVLLLAATGTALSLFHVIALLLVVGLSIDYGVFARPGDAVGAGSVSICALSSALAFAVLATADIPLLQAIGVTVTCGTILAWALAGLFAAGTATTTDHPS